jgi:sphinganine-1-phosphate aldolase
MTGRTEKLAVPCIVSRPTFEVSGRVLNARADGGQDLTSIIVTAYERYCVSNPLHPDVFPTIRKMEAEVVSMCLRLVILLSGSALLLTRA